jgi:hypothetical protein
MTEAVHASGPLPDAGEADLDVIGRAVRSRARLGRRQVERNVVSGVRAARSRRRPRQVHPMTRWAAGGGVRTVVSQVTAARALPHGSSP